MVRKLQLIRQLSSEYEMDSLWTRSTHLIAENEQQTVHDIE